MTKKFMLELGAMLRELRPVVEGGAAWDQWLKTVDAIVAVCKNNSTAFQEKRFRLDVGVA